MEYFNASIIFCKREILTIGLDANLYINMVYLNVCENFPGCVP